MALLTAQKVLSLAATIDTDGVVKDV